MNEDEDFAIDAVVEALEAEFPAAAPGRVREVVQAVYAEHAASKVRDFVPLLVERASRERLQSRS